MTETIVVAIGIGALALVFIYLGCLMWIRLELSDCLESGLVNIEIETHR